MRQSLLCVTVVVLILGLTILGNARPNQHQKHADEHADPIQKRQSEVAVPLNVFISTESALHDALAALHADQEVQAKDNRSDYEPWNAPSVLVQIGLLIVGALYTWFAKRQWEAIKTQGRLTEETLVADKRAFISADTYAQYFEQDISTGNWNWRFRPQWRNAGHTPTKDATMHVTCEIRNTVLPLSYRFEYAANEIVSVFVAAGGSLLGSQAPRASAITPQDIIDAQNNRKFIYLWGWMRYSDVFPHTPKHITHFCWLITVTGNPLEFVPHTPGQPPTPHTLTFNYLQHIEGNYAD